MACFYITDTITKFCLYLINVNKNFQSRLRVAKHVAGSGTQFYLLNDF